MRIEALEELRGSTVKRSYVEAGPYVADCELAKPLLEREEACSGEDFSNKARHVALEIDCQLQKAMNVLDLVTKKVERASKERLNRHVKLQEEDKIQRGTSAESLDVEVGNSITFDEMQDCSCDRCIGQKHAVLNGKELLLLPQPIDSGSAYSYDGSELLSKDEITYIDKARIDAGLWYASILGNQEDFAETEKFYFSPGIQQRLRYKANDPAILMELSLPKSDRDSSASCIGTPNRNLIDEGNYRDYFSHKTGSSPVRTSEARPYWRGISRFPFVASAFKVALDGNGSPMGTVAVDVNLTHIATRFLENLPLSPSAYAVIINNYGEVLSITERARRTIFSDDTTVDDILSKTTKTPRCAKGMNLTQLASCTWDYFSPLTLYRARQYPYTGVDFSGLIEHMFDERRSCSSGMHMSTLPFPENPPWTPTTHFMAYCTFNAVPEWGLIVGTKNTELETAAVFSVSNKVFTIKQKIDTEDERRLALAEDKEVKQDITIERSVDITNKGRIDLPWVVEEDWSQGDINETTTWSFNPSRGWLKPNETATTTVKLLLQFKDVGRSGFFAHIRGDSTKERGTCFRNTPRLLFEIHFFKPEDIIDDFMRRWGSFFTKGLILLVLALAARIAWKNVKHYLRNQASQMNTIEDAMSSVRNLSHPMVLMPATTFKSMDMLVSHEEAQRLHSIIWLYSVREIEAFCSEKYIVFISHQWTGWSSPDPTNQQYRAMVMSIETLMTQEGWREQDVYIWVDFTSIPQRHPATQRLAINSLTVYASNVAAFVVVAPPIIHKDLQEECNKETYQKRAWCRAEQLSHLLAVGTDKMYLAEQNQLTPLSGIESWLEQSTYVFSGELTCCRRNHDGMEKCDKEYLMVPMLGLWGQLCQRCDDPKCTSDKLQGIRDSLRPKLEVVFPRSFTFSLPSGKTEERTLFGNLLDLLQEGLDELNEG